MCVNISLISTTFVKKKKIISLIYLFIYFTGVRVLNARKFPTLHIFPSYIENQNQQKGQLIVDM